MINLLIARIYKEREVQIIFPQMLLLSPLPMVIHTCLDQVSCPLEAMTQPWEKKANIRKTDSCHNDYLRVSNKKANKQS